MSRTIVLAETETHKTIAIANADLSGVIELRHLFKLPTGFDSERLEEVCGILVTKEQLETLLAYPEEEADAPPPIAPAPDRKTEALERIAEQLRIANLLAVLNGGKLGDTSRLRQHIIESMGL